MSDRPGAAVEVVPEASFARDAASIVAATLPPRGSVVITGGTTAQRLYPALADAAPDWSRLEVFFSDERCVPPDHDDSNYKMATGALLDRVSPAAVHRMRGEGPPDAAADAYHSEIAAARDAGIAAMVLGMGADAHVCALFPGADALTVTSSFCVAVDRPDGLRGLTLTPPVIAAARKIVVMATGDAKAGAVRRALRSDEDPVTCPARLAATHPDATFVLDEAAAAQLH